MKGLFGVVMLNFGGRDRRWDVIGKLPNDSWENGVQVKELTLPLRILPQ